MRTDFTPNNLEIWIDNWQRKDVIGKIADSWLKFFPFETINVIINHSSVTIDDFSQESKNKIKLWPNVLRHNDSRGPINKNINQAYIHTFLQNKKYCIFAHDSYFALKGWEEPIISTDYDFYSAPQGDGWHLQTINGLRTFGWWDERYATMGWHEIDYLARVLRSVEINKIGKASIVDYHRIWPSEFSFVNNISELRYNSVGLEKYIQRFDRSFLPSIQQHKPHHKIMAYEWHHKKWTHSFEVASGTLQNIIDGPTEMEINWYPWLDLSNLQKDSSGY